MKYELCPKDCLFEPDNENPAIRQTCSTCLHASDVVYPEPKKKMLEFNHQTKPVEVIGENAGIFYILELMSNGVKALSSVHKSRIK